MKLMMLKKEKLSSIFEDVGEVFFASVFLGPLLSTESNWFLMTVGIMLSFASWYSSLYLARD